MHYTAKNVGKMRGKKARKKIETSGTTLTPKDRFSKEQVKEKPQLNDPQ